MKIYLKRGALAVAILFMLSPILTLVLGSEAMAKRSKQGASPGCGQVPPTAIGQTETLHMAFEGLNRKYNVHLPPSYDPDEPHSLVLNVHGYNGNSEEQEVTTSEMSVNADLNGYIVVYPEAYPFDDGEGGFVYTWNDLACNSSPGPEGPICAHNAFSYAAHPCAPEECNYCGCQDDVGFIDALLDELEARYCIDTRREYATGFSTGAEFVQRLGCSLADRLAAIVPVHGTLHIGFDCAPDAAIATMNVWGSNDNLVPPDGTLSTDGYWYTPVDQVIAAWSAAQGCDETDTPYPTVSDGTRNWTCTQRANCAKGVEVVSCSWRGPHWWPKIPQSDFGNEAIWEFLSKHRK
jgi:polyhydroxybutyrate depolymerase